MNNEIEFIPRLTSKVGRPSSPTSKIDSTLHTYIVYQFAKRGLSQTTVAKICGCSVQFINKVITGRKASSEIQRKIAVEILDLTSWDHLLWKAKMFQEIMVENERKLRKL